jgi:hypothetical protein
MRDTVAASESVDDHPQHEDARVRPTTCLRCAVWIAALQLAAPVTT